MVDASLIKVVAGNYAKPADGRCLFFALLTSACVADAPLARSWSTGRSAGLAALRILPAQMPIRR